VSVPVSDKPAKPVFTYLYPHEVELVKRNATLHGMSVSEKRRKPSPNAGGDIRRKARRALKINQVLTDSERRL
ncbi:hypothetical protein PSW72_21445, partial [Yersinia pestis]|nr:hypothetical protein [Yersinia pestis]